VARRIGSPDERARAGTRAGFGGLELSTMLSEAGVEVTLIDCSDAFVFGYSKLDVMFGRMSREGVNTNVEGGWM
jgi:NADH dehydrogenase FAD-containing subunit